MYKLKVLCSLSVFIVFNCIVVSTAKSIPFLGSIYSSVGASLTNRHDLGFVLSGARNFYDKKIVRSKDVNLSIGVDSKLPIPIVQSLRLQLNYIKNLNSYNDLIGLGLYYNIKTFPIVTPYFGVSFLNYNHKVIYNSKYTIKQKISQGLTSFNVGLSYSIPFFPFGVFAEYSYAIPGVFSNKFKFNKFDIQYSNKDLHLNIVTIGIKFYFL